MPEDKKKKETPSLVGSFSLKVEPVEFEAKVLFLKDLLNPEFVKKLTEGVGKFAVVNIGFVFEKGQDVIMLWHKGSDDVKNGVVTIDCKQPDIKDALFKALGVST